MKLNKKVFIITTIILILVVCIIYLVKINSNQKSVLSDALKFKNDYESLNGVLNEKNGKVIREVTISENNPIIYSSIDDIIKRIDDKEDFIVYFGFNDCPWCRSVIEVLFATAKKKNIDRIYYVDIKDVRDVYVLEDGEIKLQKEADKNYYKLVEKLSNVLSDYTLKNSDGETVNLDKKRIYAPNVIAVVNGEAKILKTGISSLQTDSYMNLTDEMLNDTKKQFEEVFKSLNNSTCSREGC